MQQVVGSRLVCTLQYGGGHIKNVKCRKQGVEEMQVNLCLIWKGQLGLWMVVKEELQGQVLHLLRL